MMRGVSLTACLFGSAFMSSACSDANSQDDASVSIFSDGLLYDCMTASNTFQQNAKMQSELVTSVKARRVDFLLRDEWLRRLSDSDDRDDFFSAVSKSDFGEKMSGNLSDFDYIAASEAQFRECGELVEVLELRLLNEVSN